MASTVPFLSEGKFIMLGSTCARKMGFIDVFSDDAFAQHCLGPRCPQRMHSHPAPAPGSQHLAAGFVGEQGWPGCGAHRKRGPSSTHTMSTWLCFPHAFECLPTPVFGRNAGTLNVTERCSPEVLGPRNGHHFR